MSTIPGESWNHQEFYQLFRARMEGWAVVLPEFGLTGLNILGILGHPASVGLSGPSQAYIRHAVHILRRMTWSCRR
jgi:hypothetical protein